MRIYIDTSVIGGCFDREFEEWSRKFFELANRGAFSVVVCELTYKELEKALDEIKDVLTQTPESNLVVVPINAEIETLANEFLKEGVVPKTSFADALHVASAVVSGADVLVS